MSLNLDNLKTQSLQNQKEECGNDFNVAFHLMPSNLEANNKKEINLAEQMLNKIQKNKEIIEEGLMKIINSKILTNTEILKKKYNNIHIPLQVKAAANNLTVEALKTQKSNINCNYNKKNKCLTSIPPLHQVGKKLKPKNNMNNKLECRSQNRIIKIISDKFEIINEHPDYLQSQIDKKNSYFHHSQIPLKRIESKGIIDNEIDYEVNLFKKAKDFTCRMIKEKRLMDQRIQKRRIEEEKKKEKENENEEEQKKNKVEEKFHKMKQDMMKINLERKISRIRNRKEFLYLKNQEKYLRSNLSNSNRTRDNFGEFIFTNESQYSKESSESLKMIKQEEQKFENSIKENISNHEMKYKEIYSELQKERDQRIINLKENHRNNLLDIKKFKSSCYNKIKEYEKEEEINKMNKERIYQQKNSIMKAYGDLVKMYLTPKRNFNKVIELEENIIKLKHESRKSKDVRKEYNISKIIQNSRSNKSQEKKANDHMLKKERKFLINNTDLGIEIPISNFNNNNIVLNGIKTNKSEAEISSAIRSKKSLYIPLKRKISKMKNHVNFCDNVKKDLKNNQLNILEKFDIVMSKIKKVENEAIKKEKLINLTPKDFQNYENSLEVSDLYISAIKAKLEMFNKL